MMMKMMMVVVGWKSAHTEGRVRILGVEELVAFL